MDSELRSLAFILSLSALIQAILLGIQLVGFLAIDVVSQHLFLEDRKYFPYIQAT